jgi:S-DNA-T family DNA segregation ATPase FtsK/SpoIIIE
VHFAFIDRHGPVQPATHPPFSTRAERKERTGKAGSLVVNSRILEKKLSDFGVEAKVTEVRPGPVITMYELEPAPGVIDQQDYNLSDDFCLALKASSIRIVAPIPGKAAIGIEFPPGAGVRPVARGSLTTTPFWSPDPSSPMAVGVDIVGGFRHCRSDPDASSPHRRNVGFGKKRLLERHDLQILARLSR